MKKNDYIVTIGLPIAKGKEFAINKTNEKSFPLNFIYKQKKDYSYLSPELDAKGSRENAWGCYADEHEGRNWRYATVQEIVLYNKARKPVKARGIIDNYSII